MSTHLEQQPEVSSAGEIDARPARARAAADIPPRQGAEYYDTLLWRLCARQPGALEVTYLLGVTGCSRHSGVSTLATNLAIRAADHGLGPVLLVDANVAHPQLQRLWKSQSNLGLADVLAGQAPLESCLQSTSVAGLDLLPFGDARRLDKARVDPLRVEAVVSQLRELYALVICDLPEARAMGHALLLAGALDGTLLVVRSGCVGRHAAGQAINRLGTDGVTVVGAVLTDHQPCLPQWLDQRL